jgi:hypothetical protein
LDAPLSDGAFAYRKVKDSGYGVEQISVYLIQNINFFGDHGGFQFILETMSSNVQLRIVRLLVNIVSCVREYLNPSFGKEYASNIQSILCDRMRNITDDEMKTLDKVAIEELVRTAETLISMYSSGDKGRIRSF